MPQKGNIFLKFISKFIQGIFMGKDNYLFKKKFIDYYNIDMTHIDELLSDVFNSGEMLSLSLSDYESQILLSFIGDKKYEQSIIDNNETLLLLINNIKSLKNRDEFLEIMVTTDTQIHISVHIEWKRNLLLYIIFDIKKTNLALAKNKIKTIVKNIKEILNHE